MHDEELAARGVGRLRTRHGDHAALVAEVVLHAVELELALDAVAGAAHAVAVGTAALDHEAGDDPVEDQAVIEALIGQRDEVVDRVGGFLGVQLAGHDAAVLHGDGDNGIGHSYRFLSFMVRSISRLASRLAVASRLS